MSTSQPPDGPGAPTPAAGREPIPWHFKLIAVVAGIYIGLRIVQMLGWIGVGVVELHNAVAVVLIAWNALIADWGLMAWWGKVRLIQGYPFLARVGWYLFVPQVALGIWLYTHGHRAPVGWQHYVYGLGAALGIGIGEFYRPRMRGREGMLFGLVALLLTGVAVRGFITGHG